MWHLCFPLEETENRAMKSLVLGHVTSKTQLSPYSGDLTQDSMVTYAGLSLFLIPATKLSVPRVELLSASHLDAGHSGTGLGSSTRRRS